MSTNSDAPVETNGWQWDDYYKGFWRYGVDDHGEYLKDENGDFVREWARTYPQSHDQSETDEDDDEEEEEEEEAEGDDDEGDARPTAGDQGEPDAIRNDSMTGYDPNMAEPAPDNVRDQIVFKGTPENGWYEPLDSSYRVRTRAEEYQFFKAGRVFSMLWSEPAGESLSSNNTELTLHPNSAAGVIRGKYGEKIYCSIRRFVIVRVNLKQHFVEACAITTYGGRGTLKQGCDPSQHTIVYLKHNKRKFKPEIPKAERKAGMTKDPIGIVPTEADEKMNSYSRLRLGKIYSIECNVKVRDIGMVAHDDRTKLIRYHQHERVKGFEPDPVDSETPRARPAYPVTSTASSAYPMGHLSPVAHTFATTTSHPATHPYTYPYPPQPYQTYHTAEHPQTLQTPSSVSSYAVSPGYYGGSQTPAYIGYRVSYATDYTSQDTQSKHHASGSTR